MYIKAKKVTETERFPLINGKQVIEKKFFFNNFSKIYFIFKIIFFISWEYILPAMK